MPKTCPFCEEWIAPDDPVIPISVAGRIDQDAHKECAIRAVVGSVGHQRGECECHGKEDKSEEGMSKREAARAAAAEAAKGFLGGLFGLANAVEDVLGEAEQTLGETYDEQLPEQEREEGDQGDRGGH